MNIWIYKVYRTDRVDWDEYHSAVVVAASEQEARDVLHESGRELQWGTADGVHGSNVLVQEVGRANLPRNEPEIVCASFMYG